MKLNPFGQKKEGEKGKKTRQSETVVEVEKNDSSVFIDSGDSNINRVVKNMYISEKATMLNGFNQYVFKVNTEANKSEIKKQIGKLFKVDVVDVKILKMPRKSRNIGRHTGFKSGFKKAIVVLKKGQTIQQGQQKV